MYNRIRFYFKFDRVLCGFTRSAEPIRGFADPAEIRSRPEGRPGSRPSLLMFQITTPTARIRTAMAPPACAYGTTAVRILLSSCFFEDYGYCNHAIKYLDFTI